jgi:alanyl-tRNA synthetase
MTNGKMTSREIRQSFLDFFARARPPALPSSPLVPHGDPTLLFTNAGMVQFKDVFLGRETPRPPAR